MTGPPIVLRDATPGDATAIRALVLAAYARWVPVVGGKPRPMTADYDKAVREHAFDLAFAGGELLGLIETMLEPDHLWIENVAVGPPAQGKGLGRQLLARAEARARAAGRSETRLLTHVLMTSNIALYERVGYARTHIEGGALVYMAKRLEG